jgi:hypothetical protein
MDFRATFRLGDSCEDILRPNLELIIFRIYVGGVAGTRVIESQGRNTDTCRNIPLRSRMDCRLRAPTSPTRFLLADAANQRASGHSSQNR